MMIGSRGNVADWWQSEEAGAVGRCEAKPVRLFLLLCKKNAAPGLSGQCWIDWWKSNQVRVNRTWYTQQLSTCRTGWSGFCYYSLRAIFSRVQVQSTTTVESVNVLTSILMCAFRTIVTNLHLSVSMNRHFTRRNCLSCICGGLSYVRKTDCSAEHWSK